MTETEWLASADPLPMLKSLRGKASERKLRLLACACCRQIWQLLIGNSRRAIEIMERFVDGRASEGERIAAESMAGVLVRNCGERVPEPFRISGAERQGLWAALGAAWGEQAAMRPQSGDRLAHDGAAITVDAVQSARAHEGGERQAQPRTRTAREQCHLLRDIFGNPFCPVVLDPMCCSSTVLSLARAAYEERTLPEGTLEDARLAVLADALEEAGCTSADILAHLHESGPHVRGCVALDLVLGLA